MTSKIETGFYYESDHEEDYYNDEVCEQTDVKIQDNQEEVEEVHNEEIDDFSLNNMQAQKHKKKQKQRSDDENEEEIDSDDEEYKKEYAKFPGADKIYHKIIWDEHLNKDDFVVIYEDRFDGLIEEPFSTFEILKEDIPFHRIRFYKQNNEIVWGRKDKINKL